MSEIFQSLFVVVKAKKEHQRSWITYMTADSKKILSIELGKYNPIYISLIEP